MRSSRFFFLIAPGLVLMLLLLPVGCSEGKPEKPHKPEKAEKPIKSRGPAAIALPALKLQSFADLPPIEPLTVAPAMKDRAAVVDKAINYQEVMKFLGLKLSRAQKNFLNRHKFLLIHKDATRFKGEQDLRGRGLRALDEMLGIFGEVSGDLPIKRRPGNSRLVNPDALLYAFHKYRENCLEYLQKIILAPKLRKFVQQLQSQAMAYRKISQGDLAGHYELITAQMTFTLVILENARQPDEMGEANHSSDLVEQKKPDQDDSL